MIYHILLLKNSFISKKHPKKNFACAATWASAPHPARGLRPLGNLPHPDFSLATHFHTPFNFLLVTKL